MLAVVTGHTESDTESPRVRQECRGHSCFAVPDNTPSGQRSET